MKRPHRPVIFLVSVCFTLAACGRQTETPAPRITPDAELMDVSLLTCEPCEPPCWYGLVPGESTFDEAWEVLPGLPFIKPTTIERLGREFIYWDNAFEDGSLMMGGSIHFDDDGRIESISLRVEYYLELQELIILYGEPAGFTIGDIGPTGGSPDFRSFILIWPQRGLIADITTEYSDNFQSFYQVSPLIPEMRIGRVMYFEPASNMQELVEAESWMRLDSEIETGHYHEWNGYQPLPTPEP
jgi:hypothetical protein